MKKMSVTENIFSSLFVAFCMTCLSFISPFPYLLTLIFQSLTIKIVAIVIFSICFVFSYLLPLDDSPNFVIDSIGTKDRFQENTSPSISSLVISYMVGRTIFGFFSSKK